MYSLPHIVRRWHLHRFSVIVILLALLAAGGYAAEEASLYSFVPLDSPMTVSVDVPLLWKSTATLRNNLIVKMGMRAIEEQLGISLAKDILPWAGQAAVTPDGDGWALLVQVRDPLAMPASARLAALMQHWLPSGDKTAWLAMDYKGVGILRTQITQDNKKVLKVATATMDGWLIIAVGDGVIKRVIDVRNGTNPSLEKHPLFARAMAGLPTGGVGQFCANGQGILAKTKKGTPDAESAAKDTELGTMFIAGAVTDPEDLKLDMIYCTGMPNTQAVLKQLHADAGTVTGASLAQLPDGAFATLLISNPDKWVAAVEQLMVGTAADDDERKAMQAGMAEFDEVRAMLKRVTGEVGVNASWKDDQGFGVAVAGQTNTDDDATAVAAAIKGFIEKNDEVVDVKDGVYSMPSTAGDNIMFPTLVSFTTRKQWLLGASHPDWMTKQSADPAPVLPDAVKGANLAIFGDFATIQPMLKTMGVDSNVQSMLPMSKFGQWALTLKIDEDGGAVHGRITGALPVVAVGAAVAFPVFAKARGKARDTTSINNLRQLAVAAEMYAQDHNARLPAIKATADIKKLLNVPDAILTSPRTNEPYAFNYILTGKALGAIADPSSMILFYEKTAGSDGARFAAFLDGHVQRIAADEWEKAKRLSKIK